MLRHTGARRSFFHNLRLAILLSLNAGFINAAGFIAFAVLTTNVTGHAALLAVNIGNARWRAARMVALWLFLFLAGAFASSVYIRKAGEDKPYTYTIPIVLIILILLFTTIFGHNYDGSLVKTEYFAGSLLFAMGMQNALVSMISGSVVRTTHLTGMFTDLGVDLSALVLKSKTPDNSLRRKIVLRLSIIICFLAGGLLGGYLFVNYKYKAFLVPIGLLLFALMYDYFRISIALIARHKR